MRLTTTESTQQGRMKRYALVASCLLAVLGVITLFVKWRNDLLRTANLSGTFAEGAEGVQWEVEYANNECSFGEIDCILDQRVYVKYSYVGRGVKGGGGRYIYVPRFLPYPEERVVREIQAAVHHGATAMRP